MPNNNTVAIDSHALGTLNYIRASIEAASAIAVPGSAGIAMGTIGLAAAGLTSLHGFAHYWIAIWLIAAAAGAACGGVLIALHPSRRGQALYSGPARKFALCLCPALLAGAVLTAVLWQEGDARLMPGVWLLLYGCSVLSASLVTVTATNRLVAMMGVIFVLLGIVAFEMPARWHDPILGLGFGGVHLVFGLLIGHVNRDE